MESVAVSLIQIDICDLTVGRPSGITPINVLVTRSLGASQRRSSVDLSAGMASEGDEVMAAAAAVDGPKKMAKKGGRKPAEVIGPCL